MSGKPLAECVARVKCWVKRRHHTGAQSQRGCGGDGPGAGGAAGAARGGNAASGPESALPCVELAVVGV